MKIGKYKVKVIAAGVGPDKNMNPQPYIRFQNDQGESITWYGSLGSDKAKEYAVKALVTAGFTGNDWADLSQGLKVFDGREVMITVAEETWNNKTVTKVKWINPISSNDSFKSMAASEVKAKASDKGLFAQHKVATPKLNTEDTLDF